MERSICPPLGNTNEPVLEEIDSTLSHAPMLQDAVAEDTLQPTFTKSKHVCFDRLHIREYPVILGDHPATSSGLPVTLDWTATNSYQLEVNQYENAVVRRAKLELRMPPEVRRELICHDDATCSSAPLHEPEEMRRVAKDMRRIKGQRAHSIAMQEFESLFVFMESVGRKWKRWRDSWNDDVDQDPAAIWLQQWQKEKKLQQETSTDSRR
jgi:hypothetical protein